MTIRRIGFVGTGAITEAMVRGLLTEPAYASEIYVSPRNAEVAARLDAEYHAVCVAVDNQDVVNRSDILILAIRPQIAEEIVSGLVFKDGQSVISVIAATEHRRLRNWITADVKIVQAIPLPFVADRQGVTAIYPADTEVAALFDVLGTAVQCGSKREYDLLAAASAMMSTYFGIMELATDWLTAQGLDRAKGQAYIAPLFASLAQRALRPDVTSFATLSTEFATTGGLNEQVLSDFETKGGREALAMALQRVLARIEGS